MALQCTLSIFMQNVIGPIKFFELSKRHFYIKNQDENGSTIKNSSKIKQIHGFDYSENEIT